MLIYYCLILWIGMVSLFSINIKDKKKRNRIVIILCCLGVLIIQALRASYVGVDVNAYLKGYQIAKDINIFVLCIIKVYLLDKFVCLVKPCFASSLFWSAVLRYLFCQEYFY
jgi:hypothetical protein